MERLKAERVLGCVRAVCTGLSLRGRMAQWGLRREQARSLAWDCIWQDLSCLSDGIIGSDFKPGVLVATRFRLFFRMHSFAVFLWISLFSLKS